MLDLARVVAACVIEEPCSNPVETAGLVMVRAADSSGREYIKTLTSTDTDPSFVGISIYDKQTGSQKPFLNMPVVVGLNSPYRVMFPHELIHNKSLRTADGTLVTGWAAEGSNWVDLSLTYAGQTLYASYQKILTAVDLILDGVSPIPSATSLVNSLAISVGYTRVWISNFDTAVNWIVGDAIYAVADDPADPSKLFAGFVTKTPSNVYVGTCIGVPTREDPWLGIEYPYAGYINPNLASSVGNPSIILLQNPGNIV